LKINRVIISNGGCAAAVHGGAAAPPPPNQDTTGRLVFRLGTPIALLQRNIGCGPKRQLNLI
jgi:hypothetical protein